MELIKIIGFVLESSLVACVVFWILKRANEWCYCFGKKNLPPGDMGWPIIGNMLSFMRAYKSDNPESFLDNLVKTYGRTDVYKTHLVGSPLVIVCRPELCKAVLLDDKHFRLAYPNSSELMGKTAISNLDGIEHKRQRKLTTTPISGQKALSIYVDLIEDVVMASLDEWASMNKPVELLPELRHSAFKVVTNIFFGPQGYSFLEPLTRSFAEISRGFFTKKINLPGSRYHKALKAHRKMVKIVDAAIEDRKLTNKSVDSNEKKCMLDLLLELVDEDGKEMDNQTIIDLLGSLVFGGHESTAIATMWMSIYIHDNPQVLQKIKEEQQNIISNRPSTQKGLTIAEIKQMSYTARVIHESLRVANVGVGAFRDVKEDVEINGYTVPKGWKILAMFRSNHLDPEIFPNPKVFDPSRWDNQNFKVGAYLPFGLGSRICPGNELAKLEAFVFLHHFVLHYTLERVNPKSPVVSFPTPIPKDNYLVKITKNVP